MSLKTAFEIDGDRISESCGVGDHAPVLRRVTPLEAKTELFLIGERSHFDAEGFGLELRVCGLRRSSYE